MAAKLARSQRSAARSASDPSRSLLKVGDVIAGKYRVERLLGEGGMGVVVEAYHQLLDQRVAVKLLYHDVADREAQSRLLLEARSLAKLQSEHVARVLDVDVGADGLPFIVMELLEGADLCHIVDTRGALPRWLVVDYILQALEGLAHAHARGIIHRDLKPSNLFLANREDGTQVIKILDFGISKSQDGDVGRRAAQLTGGRAVLGSPPYMSPEQVRSPKTVDHRTDIWSIGVCMYELLTNSMPFGGDELQETFAQILEKEPTPIRHLVAGVPEGLEQVVMKCLAKNRDDRYPDVAELAKALVPYGSGSWIQSADRIKATLSRAHLDDATSATRLRSPGSSIERIPLSSRRLDSIQPEFNGTASTVAVTALESKKRWIVGISAAAALIGLVLIGFTLVERRGAASTATVAAEGEAVDPPAAAVDPASIAAQRAATVPTVSVENELPGLAVSPPGTVLGASPVPPPAPTASATATSTASTKRSKPSQPAARPASSPTKKSTTSGKGLPPGLPQTRSGT